MQNKANTEGNAEMVLWVAPGPQVTPQLCRSTVVLALLHTALRPSWCLRAQSKTWRRLTIPGPQHPTWCCDGVARTAGSARLPATCVDDRPTCGGCTGVRNSGLRPPLLWYCCCCQSLVPEDVNR